MLVRRPPSLLPPRTCAHTRRPVSASDVDNQPQDMSGTSEEMRRRTRGRLLQDVSASAHKVPRLGPQTARLDAGASITSPGRATPNCADEMSPLFRRTCHPPELTYVACRPAALGLQDKEKVAAYKADIKDQLSRMGLIRGQPRQPWHATGLAASQPSTPGVAGPGPQTLRRSMSAREYRRESGVVRGAPYHLPGLSGASSGADHPHNLPVASSSRSSQVSPMISILSTPTSSTTSDSLYGFSPSASSLSLAGGEDAHYGFLPGQGLPLPAPTPPAPSVHTEEYIAYYFKHVRELEFVFSGEPLANILYPVSAVVVNWGLRRCSEAWRRQCSFLLFVRVPISQFWTQRHESAYRTALQISIRFLRATCAFWVALCCVLWEWRHTRLSDSSIPRCERLG
ncbi:hypothetical protein C8Q78DRAFT_774400 [Trametes maxima]|nr:hypothetical protein C8Q78DRAFT_774400 [Trametes maxima]